MSMLQVRWSLNAATPSKKKTLACDYNPIHKRLRDFGTEAHELEALSSGVTKPQAKAKKAATEKTAKAAPPTASPDVPVTLHSIVAELEGAGLLSSLDNGSKTTNKAFSPTDEAVEPPAQLSLGAAGLLSAAGLLPGDSAMPTARSNSSEAGNEAEASDADSSFEGFTADTVGPMDDLSDGIDPFSFLHACNEPLQSPAKCDPRTATDAVPPAPISPETSFDKTTIRKVEDAGGAVAPAGAARGADADTDADASDASAVLDENEGMLTLSDLLDPASKPESVTASSPPSPSSLDASSSASAAVAPKADTKMMSDMAFEELANELETDNSHALLTELHGLYDLDDVTGPPSSDRGLRRVSNDGDDMFFGLGASSDDKTVLLHDLGALPEDDPSPSAPLTFDGFGAEPQRKARNVQGMQDHTSLSFTPLLPPKAKGDSKGKKKAKRSKGSDGAAADAADAAPPKKKPKKAAAAEAPPAGSAPLGISLPMPSSLPVGAPAASAPASSGMWQQMTPASMLPPAPRSNVKFLPGAVQTPAPAPSKGTLGGKPASSGVSLGRTFSWQPIKFPVYK